MINLREKLTSDANEFLKDVDARRDEANQRRYKSGSATVRDTVTVVGATRPFSPQPSKGEEMLFSPNSNGQGVE